MTSVTENVPGIVFERLVPWFSEHVEPVESLSARGHRARPVEHHVPAGRRATRSGCCGGRRFRMFSPTAHDMKREYRVISALEPTGLPVPHAIALCEDPEVTGAQFYIMSFVARPRLERPQRVRGEVPGERSAARSART